MGTGLFLRKYFYQNREHRRYDDFGVWLNGAKQMVLSVGTFFLVLR
jgi:hypothetical protein